MNQRSILILTIILVVVIVGGGILVYGANKGWFGSSADVISLISRSPSPSLTPSKTSTPTPTKPAYGSIPGTILLDNVKFLNSNCNVILADGGGSKMWTTDTSNALFRFDNLFPGSNYLLSAMCKDSAGNNYFGMKGPIIVKVNQTTNVKVSVISLNFL